MITNLSSGFGITITGSGTMRPYISPGGQSAGLVRYNTSSNNLEVYDGLAWQALSNNGSTYISLNQESQNAIEWVHKKMQEERELQKLIDNHIGLRDAYEKFKIMEVLTRSDKDNNE
jgi:hypothetical protein